MNFLKFRDEISQLKNKKIKIIYMYIRKQEDKNYIL